MDGLDAVDDRLLDYLCFFMVVVVMLVFVLGGLVVGFRVEMACGGVRRCIKRRSTRRSCVAVDFARIDGFAALWACVKDVVLGNALHL